MEKQEEELVGACAASLGTMQLPIEGQRVAEAVTKITFQMVTQLKIHAEWPTTQKLQASEYYPGPGGKSPGDFNLGVDDHCPPMEGKVTSRDE